MGLVGTVKGHPRSAAALGVLLCIGVFDQGVRAFGGRDLIVGPNDSHESASADHPDGGGSVERARSDRTTTTSPSTTTTTSTTAPAPTTTAPGGGGAAGSPAATSPPAAAASSSTPGLSDPSLLTTYTGPSTVSGDLVLENKVFTSALTVAGGTVTIRNSRFRFADSVQLQNDGGTIVVEYSEFDGMNSAEGVVGMDGHRITARWSRYVGLRQAGDIGANSTFEHNVVTRVATAPGKEPVGVFVGIGPHVVVRANTIDMSADGGANNCISVQSVYGNTSDVLITGNDLTGGQFNIEIRDKEAGSLSDVRVSGNRLHAPEVGTHDVNPTSAVTAWSGNTIDGRALAF